MKKLILIPIVLFASFALGGTTSSVSDSLPHATQALIPTENPTSVLPSEVSEPATPTNDTPLEPTVEPTVPTTDPTPELTPEPTPEPTAVPFIPNNTVVETCVTRNNVTCPS